MRICLILVQFFLFPCGTFSQVKTVYLNEFGAKPNDGLSDQAAFNAAAVYINKKGGDVRLIIPAGRYLVGPLYNYRAQNRDMPLGQIWDVFSLTNCKNVTIEGRENTSVQFLDNIPFGCVPYLPGGRDSSVHIGSLFRFTNCNNIKLLNITANGNNEKFRLLNNWGIGANPYEREHEGVFILNSESIKLSNVKLSHFGRDGVIILSDSEKKPTNNLSFVNCKFDNNGRNGVSWCGGSNMTFYGCTFNYNASGKIVTNPGSGLDIEPERNALCKNGAFIKCSFTNNGGYGITSAYTTASHVTFDSCTIIGNTNYSLIAGSPYFAFTNTSFAGTALFTYDATSEAEGIKLKNCSFKDSSGNNKIYRSNYMASIQGRYIRFDNCIFTSHFIPILYTEIRKKGTKFHPENTIFISCVFNAFFKKSSTWGKWPFLVSHSYFIDCIFRSAGFADFRNMLGQTEKNIYQKESRFMKH